LEKRVEPIDEKRILPDIGEKNRVLSLLSDLRKVRREKAERVEETAINSIR
jgi:hypothetical protein